MNRILEALFVGVSGVLAGVYFGNDPIATSVLFLCIGMHLHQKRR